MKLHRVVLFVALVVALLVVPSKAVWAQTQIPPPAGPVTICVTNAPPLATTYQSVFDGGTPQAITPMGTISPSCPAGNTFSFQLPSALFVLGTHTIRVNGINAFGTTTGPVWNVLVGIAPGVSTITAVIP